MRKGEIRRQEILSVSERLFFERGYRATTLNDILGEVGCTKGSFYHHFESKLQVLEEIAEVHVQGWYSHYLAGEYASLPLRLNGLLYHALPFRAGEEGFVSVLLGLMLQADGVQLKQRLRDAGKRVFLPELIRVLGLMRSSGKAFYANPAVVDLLWEAHMALIMASAEEACRQLVSGGFAGSRLVLLLQAARFQWERLLDLDYGSMLIIDSAEMLQVLEHASANVFREDEQLRFDLSGHNLSSMA